MIVTNRLRKASSPAVQVNGVKDQWERGILCIKQWSKRSILNCGSQHILRLQLADLPTRQCGLAHLHSVPLKLLKLLFYIALLESLPIIRATGLHIDLWNFTFCVHLAVKGLRRMKKWPERWLIVPIAALSFQFRSLNLPRQNHPLNLL